MYLQELLEVAIGLIFVWLVLSVATRQVQEWIATNWLKWRSRDLEKAIGNMLADPEKVKAFYEHPLILSLSEKTRKKPSYIPAANFSAALFDIVVKAGTEESPIQKKLGELQVLVDGLKEKDPETIKKTAGNLKVIYQKLAQLTAERYALEFLPDGATRVRADCNTGRGRYETAADRKLALGRLAVTQAACLPGSLGDAYLKGLANVSGYLFDGDNLVLMLTYDSGTMRFVALKR